MSADDVRFHHLRQMFAAKTVWCDRCNAPVSKWHEHWTDKDKPVRAKP